MYKEASTWKIKTMLVGITLVASITAAEGENWNQDISNEISIGIQDGGYSRAVLDCEGSNMAFIIALEEDFEGVVYTRGSFHTRKMPCFLDATGGKEFALKFSFDDCATKYDEDLGAYTNTVVVQHDDDLIFPGDLAFSLRCHDRVTVNATLPGIKSKISLVDPDPGSKLPNKEEFAATSPSSVVILTPTKLTPPKDEF